MAPRIRYRLSLEDFKHLFIDGMFLTVTVKAYYRNKFKTKVGLRNYVERIIMRYRNCFRIYLVPEEHLDGQLHFHGVMKDKNLTLSGGLSILREFRRVLTKEIGFIKLDNYIYDIDEAFKYIHKNGHDLDSIYTIHELENVLLPAHIPKYSAIQLANFLCGPEPCDYSRDPYSPEPLI